jgi:drug/metabolite transporter (DMT)-like permease
VERSAPSPRSTAATAALALAALACFAANSLLARAALGRGLADAGTYTLVRLASGAAALVVLARARGSRRGAGSWTSGAALLAYAWPFSLAYLRIPTGTGALLLFAAVQVTMIGVGVAQGARPGRLQWTGLALALAGLAALTRPGVEGADPAGAALMIVAGAAWGVYSLLGRGGGDPLAVTAGNFLRATPLALLASALLFGQANWDGPGLLYALLSGALTSGIGYAVWYTALRGLQAFQAATVQLSVPIIAALAGSLLLDETLSLRLLLSSLAVLGGIAVVLSAKQRG